MRSHALVQPQVRIEHAMQSLRGCGSVPLHLSGAVQQLFIKLLDQLEQKRFLTFDVVVD
jgi:hypothetical protein